MDQVNKNTISQAYLFLKAQNLDPHCCNGLCPAEGCICNCVVELGCTCNNCYNLKYKGDCPFDYKNNSTDI